MWSVCQAITSRWPNGYSHVVAEHPTGGAAEIVAQNKIPQLRSDAKSWRSGIEFFRVLQKNHQKGSDHQKDPQLAQAADSFGATSKQIGTWFMVDPVLSFASSRKHARPVQAAHEPPHMTPSSNPLARLKGAVGGRKESDVIRTCSINRRLVPFIFMFQCNETPWIFHYVARSILIHRWGFKILARRCSMKGRSQCLGSWRREHVGDTFVLCWKDLQVWYAYNLIASASMMFIFLISTRCPPTPSSNSWQNILSISSVYLTMYL